jgi:16S rRNA G1207 methylase RsmC
MNGKVKHGKADRAAHKTKLWRKRDNHRINTIIASWGNFSEAALDTAFSLLTAFLLQKRGDR